MTTMARTLTAGDWYAIARNLGAIAGVEAFDRVVAAHRDNPLPPAAAARLAFPWLAVLGWSARLALAGAALVGLPAALVMLSLE